MSEAIIYPFPSDLRESLNEPSISDVGDFYRRYAVLKPDIAADLSERVHNRGGAGDVNTDSEQVYLRFLENGIKGNGEYLLCKVPEGREDFPIPQYLYDAFYTTAVLVNRYLKGESHWAEKLLLQNMLSVLAGEKGVVAQIQRHTVQAAYPDDCLGVLTPIFLESLFSSENTEIFSGRLRLIQTAVYLYKPDLLENRNIVDVLTQSPFAQRVLAVAEHRQKPENLREILKSTVLDEERIPKKSWFKKLFG